jgi:uncharacterized protein involved in response to NO
MGLPGDITARMTAIIGGAPRAPYSQRVQDTITSPPRVFVPFFIGSLVLTLTFGATLGMINLARLTTGWGLGVLPRPSVWAHGYVQVFGFMALFIMGVAYHVLPRFVGGTLHRTRLVPWSFWLQVAGVVAIACGFFHDGLATRALWIAGSASLLAAAGTFCTIVLGTLRGGVASRDAFRPWIAAGACWLVVAAALALTGAIADDVTWHRVLWTAALCGFISSWIFGVGRRILPIFLGCKPRWARIESVVFVVYQIGTAAWVVGAWQQADSPVLSAVRTAGAVLMIVSVAAYTACLGLLASARPLLRGAVRSPQSGWEKYVFAAWSWLFASLLLGPGFALVRVFTDSAESLLVFDFARHALGFGFAAQMVLGVASRVVPNFTGNALWSPRARDAAFYLLNASMLVRALEVPIGFGVWVQAWNVIAWSGPLGVMAMLLFTTNIAMTVRQRPSALIQPSVARQSFQPLVAGK